MKHFALKPILISLIASFMASSSCSIDDQEYVYNFSDIELEILQQVNQYRITQGLEVLEMNKIIYDAAREHTLYMIDQKEISHDNSNERFQTVSDQVGGSSLAENVAFGQKTATAVVNDWLQSSDHRKNIEGDYRITGISAIRNELGQYYFTQIFSD
jgi:uncharacterized protein YkwD